MIATSRRFVADAPDSAQAMRIAIGLIATLAGIDKFSTFWSTGAAT
jgi:hypothetical protein